MKEVLEEAYKNLPVTPTEEFFKEYALFKIHGRCLHTFSAKRGNTLLEIESNLQDLKFNFRDPIQLSPANWPKNDEVDLIKLWSFLKSIKFSRRQLAIMLMISSDSPIKLNTVYVHLVEATEKRAQKIKRKKKDGTYNLDHFEIKDAFLRKILSCCISENISINTILDLYAGDGNLSFYKNIKRNNGLITEDQFVITNDLKKPNNLFKKDAGELAKEFYENGYRFALVDADAYGDPGTNINILDLINITKNVLILTFCGAPRFAYTNEKVLKNWGWDRFTTPLEYETFMERTILQIGRLGKLCKKKITYIDHCDWRGNNGFRIAFRIEDMK